MPAGIKSEFLLDTSALVAFLENEAGADRVEEIIKTKSPIIPFVALLEVYYLTLKGKGQEFAEKRYAMLKSLPAEFVWEIDEPTLLDAGRFKGLHNLSLADSMIAAMAKKHEAILVHKDPEYEQLEKEVNQLPLPYKKN